MSDTRAKPRGRDTVQAALIEAGARLFAERGPRAVSVREIARAAGVNHGLVHRHFGSKAGLLQAVMVQLSGGVADAIGPPDEDETLASLVGAIVRATKAPGTHWRILARALLDGERPAALQTEFPVVSRMLAAARRNEDAPLSPEALVTLLIASALGLMLFEPYLQRATGQSDAQWNATREELSQVALRALSQGS